MKYIKSIIFTLNFIVLAFLLYFAYGMIFDSGWDKLGAGIGFYLVSLYATLPIFLISVVYFVIKKDYRSLRFPAAVALVSLLIFGNEFLKETYDDYADKLDQIEYEKEKAEEKVWYAGVKNMTYNSQSLGLSFNYVSERDEGEKVKIKENQDKIKIIYETKDSIEDEDALMVYNKDPNVSLINFAEDKYAKDFPGCKFIENPQNEIITFPNKFEVIMLSDKNGECPTLSSNVADSYILMDKNKPSKFILVSVSVSAVEAFKHDLENIDDDYVYWYQTITLQ